MKENGGDTLIIAVDFDGVLCENKFPEIGEPNFGMISLVRKLIDKGHEVILWTTRNGGELKAAVDWCERLGLRFCSINEPAPSNDKEYRTKYPTQSRKVYADLYIDDHNPQFVIDSLAVHSDYAMDNTIANLRRIIKWKEED